MPTEVRALPTPITVITADDIEEMHVQRVDQLFRGRIPGAIAWDQTTGDYYSTIVMRGASSLNLNTVKTYIDGVEVADPGSIATIDPNTIERIEISRGPQGSTVYGSDANGGVMQIFTKKGEAGRTRPQLEAKVGLGAVEGVSGADPGLRHDHSLSLDGGGELFSYRLGGSYVGTGEWVPSYYLRLSSLAAGARATQGQLELDLSARYSAKRFSSEHNPKLRGYVPFSTPPTLITEQRQQTYGAHVTYTPTARWRHDLNLGFDRTFFGYSNYAPRLSTPADTFMNVAAGSAGKAGVGYNTSLELGRADGVSAALTAGVDHYEFEFSYYFTTSALNTTGSISAANFTVQRSPGRNTGVFAQARIGLADALHLTAGVRGERNSNFGDGYGTAWAPRVGLSYVRDVGVVTAKARVAYGDAIRAPQPTQRSAAFNPFAEQLANESLGPERQRGVVRALEALPVGELASIVGG